jgi:hypothetical protein
MLTDELVEDEKGSQVGADGWIGAIPTGESAYLTCKKKPRENVRYAIKRKRRRGA